MQSKTALEADAAATQRRMDSANALLSALSGEEGRWTQQSSAFDATIQKLTGSYLSPVQINPKITLKTFKKNASLRQAVHKSKDSTISDCQAIIAARSRHLRIQQSDKVSKHIL